MLEANPGIGVLVVDADLNGEVAGLALAAAARRPFPKIDVIYTSREPFRIPEKARVNGAPSIRWPYQPQQIVGIISELRHRHSTGVEKRAA